MSATKKVGRKATRKSTTRKATTARSTNTTRRRRTTSTARRTQPKVATTVGAALGTLVVTLLLDASWPVRIGLVLLALVLVGGYLYLQGRRHHAAQSEEQAPPATQPTPSTSSTPSTPPTEDTP